MNSKRTRCSSLHAGRCSTAELWPIVDEKLKSPFGTQYYFCSRCGNDLRMTLPILKYKVGTADGTISVMETETRYHLRTVFRTNPHGQN